MALYEDIETARFRMIIVKLSDHFPLRVADWLLAGIMTTIGVTIWNLSPEIWAAGPLQGLSQCFFGQAAWGTIIFMIGVVRINALFINGALRRSPHVRAIGAALSAFIWCRIALGMFATDSVQIGIGIFPWLLIAEMYNVHRAMRDARLSDNRAQAISRGVQGHATSAEH